MNDNQVDDALIGLKVLFELAPSSDAARQMLSALAERAERLYQSNLIPLSAASE